MFFNGLPEMPIRNVTVKNVIISDAKEGVVISQAEGVVLENIHIETKGHTLNVKNAKNLTVDGKVIFCHWCRRKSYEFQVNSDKQCKPFNASCINNKSKQTAFLIQKRAVCSFSLIL